MAIKPNGSRKVQALVVDDDEDLLRLICVLLDGIGISCERAAFGEVAVALLKRLPFDLLIVDKNLPGMGGIEVARQARILRPNIVTLIITGYASEASVHRAATVGVNDYITKPIDVIHFRQRVTELLERRPALDSLGPDENTSRLSDAVMTAAQPQSESLPEKWIAWKPEQGSSSGKGVVSVLLVESDARVRDNLTDILTDICCEVVAFPSAEQAEPCANKCAFDVLVACPEILTENRRWLSPRESPAPLGSLAILDRGGIDRVIEAIQIGARGALTPPFDRSTVASEFTDAVNQLIEERYGT